MQCLTFIYTLNSIRGPYFKQIQDIIVRDIFGLDPKEFFPEMSKDTWVEYWDKSTEGYVSQKTLYHLSQRVNMMGPTAAIFGKDFELFMLEEEVFTTCPINVLEDSINTSKGTLNRQSIKGDWSKNWSKSSWTQNKSWSSAEWK